MRSRIVTKSEIKSSKGRLDAKFYLPDQKKEKSNELELQESKPRDLHIIAQDIRNTWSKVNYAAEPYLIAMETLKSIQENYYLDSAKSIVLYFLSNASSYRGEDARRIKKELKKMIKEV